MRARRLWANHSSEDATLDGPRTGTLLREPSRASSSAEGTRTTCLYFSTEAESPSKPVNADMQPYNYGRIKPLIRLFVSLCSYNSVRSCISFTSQLLISGSQVRVLVHPPQLPSTHTWHVGLRLQVAVQPFQTLADRPQSRGHRPVARSAKKSGPSPGPRLRMASPGPWDHALGAAESLPSCSSMPCPSAVRQMKPLAARLVSNNRGTDQPEGNSVPVVRVDLRRFAGGSVIRLRPARRSRCE